MEFVHLVEVVFKINDSINFLWNFYIGVCAVLLGWLFSANIKWERIKRITVSIGFTLFALINASALYNNYSMKAITFEEIQQKPEFEESVFIQEFVKTTGIGENGVVIIHIVVGLVILTLIWIHTRSKKKE